METPQGNFNNATTLNYRSSITTLYCADFGPLAERILN